MFKVLIFSDIKFSKPPEDAEEGSVAVDGEDDGVGLDEGGAGGGVGGEVGNQLRLRRVQHDQVWLSEDSFVNAQEFIKGMKEKEMKRLPSQSSALAGQERQLARQTAATVRSNTARASGERRGSDIRTLQTTNRFTEGSQ